MRSYRGWASWPCSAARLDADGRGLVKNGHRWHWQECSARKYLRRARGVSALLYVWARWRETPALISNNKLNLVSCVDVLGRVPRDIMYVGCVGWCLLALQASERGPGANRRQ